MIYWKKLYSLNSVDFLLPVWILCGIHGCSIAMCLLQIALSVRLYNAQSQTMGKQHHNKTTEKLPNYSCVTEFFKMTVLFI